jgi:hypothetical protein
LNCNGPLPTRAFGFLAMAAALALLVAGCSEIGFPAVHDMPAPRADTPLTPDQVKQATDDLISQRDHQPQPVSATASVPAPAPQQASLQRTAVPSPQTTGTVGRQ